ncbi:helix-turn-helix transcriptional regulator [Rhodanobacter umsongensis]
MTTPTKQATIFTQLLNRQEFCDTTGISYRTAEMWAHRGLGPKVTRIGKRAFYHIDDIAAWVEAQRSKADARFEQAAAA